MHWSAITHYLLRVTYCSHMHSEMNYVLLPTFTAVRQLTRADPGLVNGGKVEAPQAPIGVRRHRRRGRWSGEGALRPPQKFF